MKTKIKLDKKQRGKILDCKRAGHDADWNALLAIPETAAIIRPSLRFIELLANRVRKCDELEVIRYEIAQKIDLIADAARVNAKGCGLPLPYAGAIELAEKAYGGMSHQGDIPSYLRLRVDEDDDEAEVFFLACDDMYLEMMPLSHSTPLYTRPSPTEILQLTETAQAYVECYYEPCVRETAHEALIVMLTKLNGKGSFPISTAFVNSDRTVNQAAGFANHCVEKCVESGVKNIVVTVFDQAFVKLQQRCEQGKSLNVLELVKDCGMLAKSVGGGAECAKAIAEKMKSMLGFEFSADQVLKQVVDLPLQEGGQAVQGGDEYLRALVKERIHSCDDVDDLRVLKDVETLMDRRDERSRMHDASANINTATALQLVSTFKGIGTKTAQRFILY
jgi:hypothetical protein